MYIYIYIRIHTSYLINTTCICITTNNTTTIFHAKNRQTKNL